ncbi:MULTISPECIES: DUF6448 family protein [Proteiniphilum]|uniref:DUF6448 family protein n=1 Tax=Proteiniphilum TaxID=294702 RepID=UPI0009298C24|nr:MULTISPECIES: DUF6448 family protein [Proteiniphilum]MDY9917451.1 DUF6448 family protein [Proteiniphilum sp.]OJV85852.1 MAG: hypothetical protein BGO34_02770 [Bacteroidia bacterium 44-10]
MKAKKTNSDVKRSGNSQIGKRNVRTILSVMLTVLFMAAGSLPAFAHCDSYDGPTVKDALKALETNNVNLVLKWIDKKQEGEITSLFKKTYSLRNGDKEVYAIVEKHFLETLVRLHRKTEGAPFTGLKPAGSTKKIVQLSDNALKNEDIDGLLEKLNSHIGTSLRKKYEKVVALDKVKDQSVEKGREYVAAYVDYTHSIEALHDILEHGGGHHAH